jgi:hypothetical protein
VVLAGDEVAGVLDPAAVQAKLDRPPALQADRRAVVADVWPGVR